jgi:hypothetical protein
MQIKKWFLLGFVLLSFVQGDVLMAEAAPLSSSNVFNPNISVIGNGLAFIGNDPSLPGRAFSLNEVEIGFQSAIDPFARGDFFVAFKPEGVEVEEGHFTWLVLPGHGLLKAGRFRAAMGSFNRIHPPETTFADRPRVFTDYLGEEGLVGNGLSVAYLLPIRNIFAEWFLEVTDVWAAAPAFGDINATTGALTTGGSRNQLGYLTRIASSYDFAESLTMLGGISYAVGASDAVGSRTGRILGVDLRLKYQRPQEAQYRSIDFRNEFFLVHSERTTGTANVTGFYSSVDHRMSRTLLTGGRLDRSTSLAVGNPVTTSLLAYLTHQPSTFQSISLQGRVSGIGAAIPNIAM